jgi:glycosyltransferase involved in cell wall biosynthesis
MDALKVSVIIPVYNSEKYLPACLESVTRQTLEDIEIVCVNDGSTDSSGKILAEYADRDKRIRILLNDQNYGTLAARKNGISAAGGRYIMFLDSDDELALNACEKAWQAIEKNKTDMVRFGVELVGQAGEGLKKSYLTVRTDYLEDKSLLCLRHMGNIKGWNITNRIFIAALCKQACHEIEERHFTMAEDIYFLVAYEYYAKTYSEIEDVLYKYRRGVGGFSGIREGCDLAAFTRIMFEKNSYDAIVRFFETKPDKDEYWPVVSDIYKHMVKQNVAFWNEKLSVSDKAEGFRLLIETWGTEGIAVAVAEILQAKQNKLERLGLKNASLQKALTDTRSAKQEQRTAMREKIKKLRQEKADLLKSKAELVKIRQSKGYQILSKFYQIRDIFRPGGC